MSHSMMFLASKKNLDFEVGSVGLVLFWLLWILLYRGYFHKEMLTCKKLVWKFILECYFFLFVHYHTFILDHVHTYASTFKYLDVHLYWFVMICNVYFLECSRRSISCRRSLQKCIPRLGNGSAAVVFFYSSLRSWEIYPQC